MNAFTPGVIEPSFGIDRIFSMLLEFLDESFRLLLAESNLLRGLASAMAIREGCCIRMCKGLIFPWTWCLLQTC